MKKRMFALLTAMVMIIGLCPISVLAEDAHEHSNEGGHDFTGLDGGQHSYVCSCGETVTEDCSFALLSYDETEHWIGCNFCLNSIDREAHTIVDCECTGETCDYHEHVVETWTPAEDNSGTHVGFCSACQRDVSKAHLVFRQYSESEHWYGCDDCVYEMEGSREAHDFDDWISYGENKHYKYCGCGYTVYELHTDADNDGWCDIESCGSHVCIDENEDHNCDSDGNCLMSWKCIDENEDHICDVSTCGDQMYWECMDENEDHVCDVSTCARYMNEDCIDEDGDLVCDVCEKNCCDHYFDFFTSNGDGTHTGVCMNCEDSVTEDCEEYIFDWDQNEHYDVCCCGYRFSGEAHTYENRSCDVRSLAGHWLECDNCGFEHYEAHTASSGVCEICELTLTQTFDVYVGGKGLKDGQYLDNSGNVTETKPEGGHAYYKDGVLELNGFVYEGEGVMWQESEYYESYATVFATKDLILKMTGENRLSSTAKSEEDNFYSYGDGIAAVGSLTVRGEGSLTILATNDGINIKESNFTMESGTLTLGILEYNEDGTVKRNVQIGDDGIDVDYGDLKMSGGTLNINADDHGMDVSGSITISGGTANMVVGDDGIEADETVTITGGKIHIDAKDEMIRGSSVIVSVDEKDDESVGGTDVDGDDNGDADGAATDTESKGLSGGAVAGITVGSVVLAEVGGFSIFWFAIKKKKLSDLIGAFKRS